MIPFLLSLAFGLGVFFLYLGLTARRVVPTAPPRAAARRAPRRWGVRREVETFLVRAGLHGVSPRDFVLCSLGSGVACGLGTQLFLGWGILSALAFALGMALPVVYYVHRHDRRRAALQVALVDAVAQLRDALRSGLAMQEAFAGLARSGPEVLRPEFDRLVADAQLRGFGPALARMKERLADPLFDVAWWAWAVSFASPSVLGAAWLAFLQGARIDPTDPQLPARVHALQVLRMLELVTDETSLSPDIRRVVADRLRAMLR
jgi:hypothetical protein